MKHRFFLTYIPFMCLIGALAIYVAGKTEKKVIIVGYQVSTESLGAYDGDVIEGGGVSGKDKEKEPEFYNGSKIEDNGMPYCIKVNKAQNVVTIYKLDSDGYYTVPYKAMVCSVGEKGNTPEGIFELGDRSEWLPLEGDVYGQYATHITGSFLFHSVPYFTQNKADLEIEEYNKLGTSVSAGCVRLSVIDSKWIYDNCGMYTKVEIFSSDYPGPMGKPEAAVISGGEIADGHWDPTDPDRDNPYMGNVPVILGAYDREVERFSSFDVSAGVTALDSEGNDITNKMKIQTDVTPEKCGTGKVTYTVTEDSGLTATATANITVKDEEPPVIYVDQVVDKIGAFDVRTNSQLRDLLMLNVTAFDGKQQLDDKNIVIDYSEIMKKGFGKCHVKYLAKDSEGNVSDVVVLTINVDMEPPQLELVAGRDEEVSISSIMDDAYLQSLVKATDNSGNVELTVSRPLSYRIDEPYIVVYCAKDAFGNVSTLSVNYQLVGGEE